MCVCRTSDSWTDGLGAIEVGRTRVASMRDIDTCRDRSNAPLF